MRGWIDDHTWRAWIGRLYLGYARDLCWGNQQFMWRWRPVTLGRFVSVTLGVHTFAVGWANR